MKKVAAVVLAVALVAGGIGVLHAASSEDSCMANFCHFGKGRMLKAFLHKMADELNLTQEQKGQIKAVVQRNKPEAKGYIQRLRSNHQTMCKLHEKGSVSDQAIEEYAKRQADIVAKMIVMHQKAICEIRPIFNEEQIEKIKRHKEEKRKRMDKFLAEHCK